MGELSTTRRWYGQLTDVLLHVHNANVIHGDVGSHNVLISQEKSTLLCDFGGSRIDLSPCFAFPSARYRRLALAVENRGQYEPTEKDDIFALGMVFYEVATLEIVWGENSHPEILEFIKERRFPPLQAVHDAKLKSIIQKCWLGQYSSIMEVKEDLLQRSGFSDCAVCTA